MKLDVAGLWLRGSLLAFGLVFANATFANPARSVEAQTYSIQWDLTVDGASIASPSAIADFGKEVELTVGGKKGGSGWKMRFTVDKPVVMQDGTTEMPARFQIFEVVGGNEILRAEPSFTVLPSERADMDLPLTGGAGRRATIGLTIQIQPDPQASAIQEGLIDLSAAQKCSSEGKGVIGVDDGRQCCGGRCPDGEPWTCCGASQCCVCGSCCRP